MLSFLAPRRIKKGLKITVEFNVFKPWKKHALENHIGIAATRSRITENVHVV